MKIVLFSLLCLILIGMTSYSYAQWVVPDKNTKLPEVTLQFEIRDKNGILISYVETNQIIGIYDAQLNRFLDNLNQTKKEFLIKDDNKYEMQQWEQQRIVVDKKNTFSVTRFVDVYQNDIISLLNMRHDSVQTQPGDKVRLFWTIIRPAS